MPHYIVALRNQEICEFVGKHFNGGVVPEVNEAAYYVITPDNSPNRIIGPAEYLDIVGDKVAGCLVFMIV